MRNRAKTTAIQSQYSFQNYILNKCRVIF